MKKIFLLLTILLTTNFTFANTQKCSSIFSCMQEELKNVYDNTKSGDEKVKYVESFKSMLDEYLKDFKLDNSKTSVCGLYDSVNDPESCCSVVGAQKNSYICSRSKVACVHNVNKTYESIDALKNAGATFIMNGTCGGKKKEISLDDNICQKISQTLWEGNVNQDNSNVTLLNDFLKKRPEVAGGSYMTSIYEQNPSGYTAWTTQSVWLVEFVGAANIFFFKLFFSN